MGGTDAQSQVIIFTGLPGTGKSTLAEQVATLVTRQLMLGQDAVVDALVSESQVAAWRTAAARFSARWYLIECICSDEVIHRGRVEGRIRGIPGWHEIGWDFVERMRAELSLLSAVRLTIDAMEPVADNLRRVLDYISA
jgi:hypothetical protein